MSSKAMSRRGPFVCFLLLLSLPAFCLAYVRSNGLQNLGNTCYLNAQMQCAFHIPIVRRLVTHQLIDETEPSVVTDDTASTTSTESTEGDDESVPREGEDEDDKSTEDTTIRETPALLSLRRLFIDMEESATTGIGIAAPRLLCQTLGIPVLQQQDSQEFWKLLLPALGLSKLTQLYSGYTEEYIRALDGSGREKRRQETYTDLSLNVRSGAVASGLDALFGEPELLSEAEGNGWRPEKGSDKVDAHKGSVLKPQGLPPILQLHLKRFHFDWNTETTTKINTPFAFESELDLTAVCKVQDESGSDALVYDLQAIVVHAGEYDSGHYYAYVRPDVRSDVWYRFDDHNVQEVAYKDVFTDACGGKGQHNAQKQPKGRWFSRLGRALLPRSGGYGYGGRASNAYVLQYVQRSKVPMLYDG